MRKWEKRGARLAQTAGNEECLELAIVQRMQVFCCMKSIQNLLLYL
jgi:hypothetical protein